MFINLSKVTKVLANLKTKSAELDCTVEANDPTNYILMLVI